MILNKIKEFIIQNNLIKSGDNIICAMSGGIDSTFLFFILYKLSNQMKFNLSACHINHCLRKESSYNDMHFIQEICNNNKINLDYKIIDTISFCKKKKYSIELGAREIRYNFFNELLNKYSNSKIATAHNYNDNVETIILNLLRGCYTLKGIPIFRENIIRPLLNIKRVDILDFLVKNNIKYKKDITNEINKFNRNKIRNLIFPIFQKINNKYSENITNTYFLLKEEDEYLNKLSYELMKDLIYTDSNFLKIDINKIIKLEYFLIRRILILSVKLYTKVTFINEQINNIIKMLFSSNPSATIEINNYNFNRIYNWLYIYEKKDKIQINKLSLDFIKPNKKYKITIIDKLLILDITIKNNIYLNQYYNKKYNNKNIFYLDYDKIDISTFNLRTRTPNDKIYLDDYYGYRKLKNIFINKKIPKIYRDLIPILVDQNNIICCLFVGTNKNYNVTCKTKKILILKFRSNLYNGIFC